MYFNQFFLSQFVICSKKCKNRNCLNKFSLPISIQNNIRNVKHWLVIILLVFNSVVYSETSLEIQVSRNYGEHIFELGNKYPNISGFRGGSRITYNRDFYKGGMVINHNKDNLFFSVGLKTTGWYLSTLEKSRDEDFAMGEVTSEKGRKFSFAPLFLYDTAHTFTGTSNFADATAKSVVSEYSLHFGTKYFFHNSQNLNLSAFFLSEPSYAYFKYILYDVMQFVRRPFYYGPIGNGLSYSHSYIEFPVGLGCISKHSNFSVEFSLQLLLNYFRYRDFHYQRNLNFIGSGLGDGFIYQIIFSYPIDSNNLFKIYHRGHRMFGISHFKTKGGVITEDVLSNFYGYFHSYVTTKESSIDVSFQRLISN